MLDQEGKIKEIVKKFDLTDLKPTYTLMSPNYYIDPKRKLLGDNVRDRKAVGTLLYVLTTIRPDILACINILGRLIGFNIEINSLLENDKAF